MAESGFERSEAPTPRRRQEARQDGNVARSADLTAAIALLAAILLLHVFGLRVLAGMKQSVIAVVGGELVENPTRLDEVGEVLTYLGQLSAAAAGPLVLCIAAVALLASLSQVGFLFTIKPLEPDFAKLSPLRGVRNMVNMRAVVRLVMSLGKLILLAGVAAWAIAADLPHIIAIAQLEPMPMLGAGCELIYALALKLAALLLLLAIVDYAFQRWQHTKDLRMTRQEIKEEMKRMEGDPLIKQRRTRVARQLALQRIGQAVPRADVVVTNPTHFAVALRYDSASMTAPKVVAKGADFLAMRIRQLAMANEVPLVERKELARALYRNVEVGQEIPPQFYSAVAEILAYVYRISGRKSA